MCQIIEELQQEAIQETRTKNAVAMLKRKLPFDVVVECSSLTIEEVKALTQKLALAILEEVYTACKEIFSGIPVEAYLYGSYARGDYHKDSDMNFLVLADMDWLALSGYHEILGHLSSDLSLKYHITVVVITKPLPHFYEFSNTVPLYKNILAEGIRYKPEDSVLPTEL